MGKPKRFLKDALAQNRPVVSAFGQTGHRADMASGPRLTQRRPRPEKELQASKLQTFAPVRLFDRAKVDSIDPFERLNGEIKRRTEVVGIFPNEDAIVQLVGAILLEQNDEWAVRRAGYMTLETIAPMRDDPAVNLPSPASLHVPSATHFARCCFVHLKEVRFVQSDSRNHRLAAWNGLL
jgi:hypothetical protein